MQALRAKILFIFTTPTIAKLGGVSIVIVSSTRVIYGLEKWELWEKWERLFQDGKIIQEEVGKHVKKKCNPANGGLAGCMWVA